MIPEWEQVLLGALRPGLYLNAVSEVPLAIRLHKLGILSEEQRKTFVGTIVAYAVEGSDAAVLENDDLRGMLTLSEFAELRRKLRTVTIPKLRDIRRERESDHDYNEDPEDHMSSFLDVLKAFEKLFHRSKDIVKEIRRTRSQVREWISQRERPDPESRLPRELARPASLPHTSAERSIFDDVDA